MQKGWSCHYDLVVCPHKITTYIVLNLLVRDNYIQKFKKVRKMTVGALEVMRLAHQVHPDLPCKDEYGGRGGVTLGFLPWISPPPNSMTSIQSSITMVVLSVEFNWCLVQSALKDAQNWCYTQLVMMSWYSHAYWAEWLARRHKQYLFMCSSKIEWASKLQHCMWGMCSRKLY